MSLELLALGADFVGGLMGHSSARKDRELYKQSLAQAQQQFAAQMDTSVQRRVADAKKAGIHPLFAMGASVGASPTISAGRPPRTGNPRGDALSRMAASLGVIEKNRAAAKRDEAEAMLLDSERARIEQEVNARGNDSSVKTFPYGTNPQDELVLGPAEYVAPQVSTSKAPGIESGVHPGLRDYMWPDGKVDRIFSEAMQADELNQFVLAGGLMQYGVRRGMNALGWEKDENGVWRKVRKREPWIRIRKDKTGETVFEF